MKKTSKEKLKQALEICVNEEVEKFSDELPFEASEEFEKKMQKLINDASKSQRKFTLTGMRRTIIIIAAVLVLMLSTFSVNAVRDTAGNFFVKVFSTRDKGSNKSKKTKKGSNNRKQKVGMQNNSLNNKDKNKHKSKSKKKTKNNSFKKTIEEVYELGFLPDGFELCFFDNTGVESTTEYSKNDEQIIFKQYVKSSYTKTFDNESVVKEVEIIDDQKYKIYTSTNLTDIIVVWNNGKYIFSLSSTLSKDEMISLCQSIRVKPKEDYPEIIEKIYELEVLPGGFELVNYEFNLTSVLYEYSAGNKNITFIQNTNSAYSESAENETAIKHLETHDDQKYTVYAFETGDIRVVWHNGEYVFSVFSNLSKDDTIELCKSINVAKYIEYSNTIKYVYEISSLPSGFVSSSFEKSETEVTTEYSSDDGYIKFKQYINSKYSFGVYVENADKTLKVINGKKYMVYTFADSGDIMLVWEEGKYIFSIKTNLSENEAFDLCKSVVEKDEDSEEITGIAETTKKKQKNKKETIKEIYELSFLPDGYSIVDYDSNSSKVSYVYCCNDKKIVFTQNTKSSFSSVDKQSATVFEEIYNNQKYTIYTYESGDVDIIWNNGEYVFELFGNLDKDLAFDMCKSIKIKKINFF